MAKYTSNSPRLTVKFVDSDTDTVLFEIKDKTWMNIGEVMTDWYIDAVMKTEMKNKKIPQNLMVLVIKEVTLE